VNRFALLTVYRSLSRHSLYAALNIGGLAVGIAVFLALGLYVRFTTSFEKWLPHHDQIYVVQTGWHVPGPFVGDWPATMPGLLEELKGDFPEVVGARLDGNTVSVIRNGIGVRESLDRTDPSLLDVLSLPIVRGQAKNALSDPGNLLINETLARKYFPDADAIGQNITIVFAGETHIYRVAAIFKDLPKATEIGDFGLIVPFDAKARTTPLWYHWGSVGVQTFLRFNTPAEARAFQGQMPAFVLRHGKADLGADAAKMSLDLLPIRDTVFLVPGRKLTVTTLGLVGLLTLLIAIINYVNLATARAGLRAREVAMRKVMGATRAALIGQYLGEAIAVTGLAALIGLALAELGLPLINAAGALSLTIPYAEVIPALAVLTVIAGALGGLYPAILLARIPAAQVLASTRLSGGGRLSGHVREGLVVFQFTLAVAFLIGTLVLFAQTRHVRQTDLGFRHDGLVSVGSLSSRSLTDAQRASLIAAFRTIPAVRSQTFADAAAGDDDSNTNINNVHVPGRPGNGPVLQEGVVGPDFFSTYGARLIAGRVFDASHGGDDTIGRTKTDPRNIVINRRAVTVLGFRSPEEAIGKTVGGGGDAPLTIIGVVENVRFFSPRDPVNPTYYEYISQPQTRVIATLRISGDPRAVIAALRAQWLRFTPQIEFDAQTTNQGLAKYYKNDDRDFRLFTIGSVLAVLIGCVGLWGLASFNTTRRVKEIGIRKTLGASSADIVKLLVGQFLRPVLIANLIAWPLAWVAMSRWLAGFDDRIALSPLYFIAATILAVAIAALTVIGQSLSAARATPAWALRHE
jgi:putative ABC transport system permease protein